MIRPVRLVSDGAAVQRLEKTEANVADKGSSRLEPGQAQLVEQILQMNAGSVSFMDLSRQVPGLKLADLKAAYPVSFKDGQWVINSQQVFAASYEDGLKTEIIKYLDSFGGFRSVYRTQKKFDVTRAQLRGFGLDINKETIVSPTCSAEAINAAELKDPLGEDRLQKIVELLANAGGVLTYQEIGEHCGNVTKAQLQFHFELEQFSDGRCEVRIPGVVGTMEQLRVDALPLAEPIPTDILQNMTAWIEAKGGSVDAELLRDEFPTIKKSQLRDHFDVELTHKVKETGKRFYAVSIRGGKNTARQKAIVAQYHTREMRNYLSAAGYDGKGGKGKAKGDKGKGKDFDQGKGKEFKGQKRFLPEEEMYNPAAQRPRFEKGKGGKGSKGGKGKGGKGSDNEWWQMFDAYLW